MTAQTQVESSTNAVVTPLELQLAPRRKVPALRLIESHIPSKKARQSFSLFISDSVKRVIDVLGALTLLTVLLPVMTLVALSIRISSRGPSIYLQRRLTRNGKVFTIFKFRTMFATAERDCGAVMAQAGDVRITRLGKFLRKTRLDELPQLINVLIGDMSLIGPRPERPEIAAQLSKELPQMHRRLEVNAGLTGLAQIKSGYASSVESYREKLQWDIQYVEQRSLLLDAQIAVQTIGVILTGYGAR